MRILQTNLPEVLVLEPQIFGDSRGWFCESFNQKNFAELTGLQTQFVQDNHSFSKKNTLRGLHYQIQQAQGKLVRVIAGHIFDVAVDIRQSSPRFGQWVGVELSAENKYQLWVPAGFAHGFLVLSAMAEVLYKTTDYYAPSHERAILWDDPNIGIDWPLSGEPILSAKDLEAKPLKLAEVFA
jgi:dTDP-4-dehydrorhamnose 3,5-epimerase